MGDITENFSRYEFACRCGCGFNEIDERLVHRLQVVRDIVKIPMIINSGCRCIKHNNSKGVGGKPGSFHLIGKAGDWYFDCPYDEKLYLRTSVLLASWSGGFHYYKEKRFFVAKLGSVVKLSPIRLNPASSPEVGM